MHVFCNFAHRELIQIPILFQIWIALEKIRRIEAFLTPLKHVVFELQAAENDQFWKSRNFAGSQLAPEACTKIASVLTFAQLFVLYRSASADFENTLHHFLIYRGRFRMHWSMVGKVRIHT